MGPWVASLWIPLYLRPRGWLLATVRRGITGIQRVLTFFFRGAVENRFFCRNFLPFLEQIQTLSHTVTSFLDLCIGLQLSALVILLLRGLLKVGLYDRVT